MMAELSGVTTEVVKLALDAAGLRHQAIANNIANANTPGYVPLRVNFEEQLDALRHGLGGSETALKSALGGVKAFIEQDVSSAGSGAANIMLDMEAVKLSQNVVHYQSLLRGLGKQMSILSAAINDGRR